MHKVKLSHLLFVFPLLVVGLLIGGCEAEEPEEPVDDDLDPDEVVLRVDDEIISRLEYEERFDERMQMLGGQMDELPEDQRQMMEHQLHTSLREQMKNRLVLKTAAREAGIEVTDEDIDEFIEEEFPQGEIDQVARQLGLSEEEMKDRLHEDVLIQRFIDQNIEDVEVEEQELRDHYELHKQRFAAPDEEPPAFEEVEPQVRAEVEAEQEQQLIEEFVQPLVEEAEIEENWPELEMPEQEAPMMPEAPPEEPVE